MLLVTLFTFDVCSLDIIAHRGSPCGGSENSIKAIQNAWRMGADAVEIDLRMTADKRIVLFHDEKIKGRPLAQLSYIEIKKIRSDIAELAAVLNGEVPIVYYIFDLKQQGNAYLRVLSEGVKNAYFPESKIVFQSDQVKLLLALRAKPPNAKYSYLTKLKKSTKEYAITDPLALKKYLLKHGIASVSIKGRRFLNREFIDPLRRGGIDVHVWTINDPRRAKFYANLGVSGIITDSVLEIQKATKQTLPNYTACSY